MGSDHLTSKSLLAKATARDPDAWQRLVTLYTPLVGIGVASGASKVKRHKM